MEYSYSTADPDKSWPLILIGRLGQYLHLDEGFAFDNQPSRVEYSLQVLIDHSQMTALTKILEYAELSGTVPNPINARATVAAVRKRLNLDNLGSLGIEFPYLFDGNRVDLDAVPPIWADQDNRAYARDFLPDQMVAVQVELGTYLYKANGSTGAKCLLKRVWTLQEAVPLVAVPYTPRRKTKNWTPGASPSKRADGFEDSNTSPTKKTRHK